MFIENEISLSYGKDELWYADQYEFSSSSSELDQNLDLLLGIQDWRRFAFTP